jgi:hypothetical protein
MRIDWNNVITDKLAPLQMRDVVFTFSEESLADALEREFCRPPDQALLALRRAPNKIRRVAVANPWRSAPITLARKITSSKRRGARLEGTVLIEPMRIRRRDPANISSIKYSYRRYDSVLERHVAQLAFSRPAILTFNPFVAAFCPLKWTSSITFYAQDDWAEGPISSRLRSEYLLAYDAIRQRQARIICVSDELAIRVAGNGPAVVLPNGIDEQWWQLRPEPPAELSGLPRPIITYVGTIEGRTDVGLIEKLANEKAIGSIAFIGPVGDKAVGDALTKVPKVTLCGHMMRVGVVGSIMHSDVCIIPHIIGPFTRAMSPIKQYEYLAGGMPVVTTDLPPVKNISERVLVATGDDFPRAVLTALEMPPQTEEDRLEFVRSNSWTVRLERMLQVMLADDTNWWEP